jgi:hypothetical protein
VGRVDCKSIVSVSIHLDFLLVLKKLHFFIAACSCRMFRARRSHLSVFVES